MSTPIDRSQDLAALFPNGVTGSARDLIDRHQHLVSAISCLDQDIYYDVRGNYVACWTGRVADSARDLAAALEPLITYLPVIAAALDDAADYRAADGWCAECHRVPSDERCADHAHDQIIATAYEAARHAITG